MSENEITIKIEEKASLVLTKLHERLSSINALGAHPSLLNNINVEYYEVLTPINQLANISSQDAITLIVTPFDQTVTKDIIEAINKANIGLNPIDEGKRIRINVPPLTSEKREVFIKDVKKIGEEFKISIRNIRQDANKKIKSIASSENEEKIIENDIQKKIDEFIKKIDEIVSTKIDNLRKI